jgi:hypothetical protein
LRVGCHLLAKQRPALLLLLLLLCSLCACGCW